MPNDCYNTLSIDANDALIERIMNHVRNEETEFDFEKIIPMPENIYRGNVGPEERKLYGDNNWYDWSCKHWGTKWNAYDIYTDPGEIYFHTAWNPCVPVITELAKQFPEASFSYTYDEPGMCFAGEYLYQNGECVCYFDVGYDENYYASEDGYDEEEAKEYTLTDNLYSVLPSGERVEYTDIEDHGLYVTGNLHYREYNQGMIVIMADGQFKAIKSYALEHGILKKAA
jgi:hypothetical protein